KPSSTALLTLLGDPRTGQRRSVRGGPHLYSLRQKLVPDGVSGRKVARTPGRETRRDPLLRPTHHGRGNFLAVERINPGTRRGNRQVARHDLLRPPEVNRGIRLISIGPRPRQAALGCGPGAHIQHSVYSAERLPRPLESSGVITTSVERRVRRTNEVK